MSLTTAQLATLKAAIAQTPNLAAFAAAGQHGQLAAFANARPATGGTLIFRSDITVDEIKAAVDAAEFNALTGNAPMLFLVLVSGDRVDATIANTRDQFAKIFPLATAPKTSAALSTAAQRIGSPFEVLFTTNGVSAVFGQQLAEDDIRKAIAS